MSEHYPRFRRSMLIDGERYLRIRECMRIAFYLRREHSEIIPSVMGALETYLQVVGPNSLGWYFDEEGDAQPLDERGREYIRRRLLSPRGANVSLIQEPDSVTGHEFTYRGQPLDAPPPIGGHDRTCAVTFWLPTESIEEQGPQWVRELALKLAAALPFNSGHAGLCYLYPEGLMGMTESIREECFRYPGIDLADTYAHLDLGTRVEGAHWLTFLGPPVLEELGGAEGLRSRLRSPNTTVQAIDAARAVVTLGPWPEAGDLEEGRTLPEYRELARVLEPWLYEPRSRWRGFSPEDMRRWYRRFLD